MNTIGSIRPRYYGPRESRQIHSQERVSVISYSNVKHDSHMPLTHHRKYAETYVPVPPLSQLRKISKNNPIGSLVIRE